METPKDKPHIFHNPYQAYCDTFNCTRQAKHFLGRPDGPLNICLNLCDECLTSVLEHMPDELKLRMTPPAGYVLVERDYYEELQTNAEAAQAEPEQEDAPEFTCTECGKSYPTQQGLAAHMRVHKGDK